MHSKSGLPPTETTLFLHVVKVRVGGTASISAFKILDVFLYEIKMNNIISIYKYFKSLR